MAYYPATSFVPQFFSDPGVPLAGGSISAQVAGSSTPTSMYLDGAGTSAGTSITLNARGEPQVSGNTVVIWLDSAITYKFILKDASAVSKWTIDSIAASIGLLGNSSNVALGDALVAVKQPYSGAVATTQHAKNTERISVRDFGAVGDGTTSDAAAFLAAGATGREVFVPYTSSGYNLGTTVIPVISGQFFTGENQVLIKSQSTTACFLLQGYDYESGVRHFRFDMTGAGASSSAIRFDTSVNVVWRVRLDDLRFENCYAAIDQAAGPAYITDVICKDLSIIRPKGTQINFHLSRGSFKWERVNIDSVVDGASSTLVTYSLAKFVNYAGLELYKFDVAGQNGYKTQVYDAGAIGIEIDNTGAPGGTGFLWMDRVRVESSMGPGISIKGNNFFYGNMVETFSTLGDGIRFLNCTIGQGTNIYARGGKDQSGKLAGQNGIYLDTTTDFVLSSVAADSNDGAGILVATCSNIGMSAVKSANSGTYGYLESGTSSGNSVTEAHFVSNTTAPFSIINARISNAKNAGTRLADSASFYAHKNGTDQTGVLPTTFTLVTFGTAAISSTAYNTGTSRWTPPAGTYQISASLAITANVVSGSELTILIYKNGSAFYQADYYPGASSATSIGINRAVVANGTDYFEVYVYLAGAGNKTIGGAVLQSSFEGHPI